MKITELPKAGHIGIVVADLAKSMDELNRLYRLPGMANPKILSYKPYQVFALGKEAKDVRLDLCIVDFHNDMKLEILQWVSGEIEHDEFVRATGGGIHHMQHFVDEYDDYRQFMLEQGGVVTFEAVADDERGFRQCAYFRMPVTNAVIEIATIPRLR